MVTFPDKGVLVMLLPLLPPPQPASKRANRAVVTVKRKNLFIAPPTKFCGCEQHRRQGGKGALRFLPPSSIGAHGQKPICSMGPLQGESAILSSAVWVP